VIYKARLLESGPIASQDETPGIKFKLLINKNGQDIEVFSDSWMSSGKTVNPDGSVNAQATNMTRKRLKLIGLDMDKCTVDDWIAFSTNKTLFAGVEVEVLEKSEIYNNQPQFKYEIALTPSVTPDFASKMFELLKGKGAATASAQPSTRPSMAVPQGPRAPRPIASPTPAPAAPTQSSII
jgi:hypothetical protein